MCLQRVTRVRGGTLCMIGVTIKAESKNLSIERTPRGGTGTRKSVGPWTRAESALPFDFAQSFGALRLRQTHLALAQEDSANL